VVGDPLERDVLAESLVTKADLSRLRALDPVEAFERIESERAFHERWAKRRGAFLIGELKRPGGPVVRPTGGRQAAMAPS